MRYAITHATTFSYAAPMRYARCNLRLKPFDWPGQRLLSHAVTTEPASARSPVRVSAYAGSVERILIDRPTERLVITSRSELEVDRVVPAAMPDDPTVAEVATLARASTDLGKTGPASYLYPSPMIALTPAITDWCAESLAPDAPIVAAAAALTNRITAEFRYDGTATETGTTPAESFAAKAGVCQDFAQVMIAGCRGLGLPAAYVSGYLRTYPPAGRPRLVGADATHAWVMLWCGDTRGWIGFDPTNACLMGPDHIVTAVGRDYADVAPIDGIFIGTSGQKIAVSVDVAPLD